MKLSLLWMVLCAAFWGTSCGESPKSAAGGTDDDSASDTDSDGTSGRPDSGDDSGGEPGIDGGATEKTACLGSISGRVLKDGKSGMEAVVMICIGARCMTPATSDAENGTFVWAYPTEEGEPCGAHDFSADPIHFEISAIEDPDLYAGYAFVREPSQAEISDNGAGDFELNLGDLFLYTLPTESTRYTPEAGAEVFADGLSFALAPNAIIKRVIDSDEPIDHEEEIRLFEAPLDVWQPPFADSPLDRLYFIAPRWAKLDGDGVRLTMEAPSDWGDTDEGTMYLLGSFLSNYGDAAVRDRSAFIYRNGEGLCINTDETDAYEEISDGRFESCGSAALQCADGTTPPCEGEERVLVTSPIPRFTWIGIARK